MGNKIQNIVLKSIMGIVFVLGIVFIVNVLSSGDPGSMSDQEMEQFAIKEAKAQGLEKSMSQIELNQWVVDRGLEIKTEKEKITYSAVSTVIDFTQYVLYLTIFLVIASVGYLFTVDAKKAAINVVSVLGVVAILYVIYAVSGTEVPAEYIAKETLKGVEDADRVFTPGNWQLASASLTATIILTSIAAIGWVAGSVIKMIK